MNRRGFALVEIGIIIFVLAIIAGAAFYIGRSRMMMRATAPVVVNATATPAVVEDASQTIQDTVSVLKQSPSSGPAVAISAPASTRVADPLAGLGSDIYADGILPLGDGKYTTTAPKKGYVYLCNVVSGGEGAEVNGPWIGTSTWNSNEKISVEGSALWPNASVSISVSGSTRTIVTSDLPVGASTGIFPIASTDPAYQYDTNPNNIEAQNLSFSLPADPTIAASPSCIYGEVGVMTNGVLLLDAFDAEYRDAAAHEMQDSCDGHPHQGGMYHYHSLSSCIASTTVTNIIGWAFDGFPITGPEISPNRYLTTADLDECHGITSPVMLNGSLVNMYHYVMTQDFPYSVSCFRGVSHEPMPSMSGMSGMGMSGASSQSSSSVQNPAGASGTPPAPPQSAIDACVGKASGASCTVGQGTSGTCTTIGSDFACKP